MATGKKTDAALTSNDHGARAVSDKDQPALLRGDVGTDDRSYPIADSGAAMAAKRPLSPHLQIYRLPITALLSISHRLSGVILVAGMLALVICLMAGAAGPEPYAQVHAFLNAWPGQLFIWGWIYALFFHWCHGVRHLVWDIGNGFSREYQDIAAYLEITVSLFFTLTAFLANHYLWS